MVYVTVLVIVQTIFGWMRMIVGAEFRHGCHIQHTREGLHFLYHDLVERRHQLPLISCILWVIGCCLKKSFPFAAISRRDRSVIRGTIWVSSGRRTKDDFSWVFNCLFQVHSQLLHVFRVVIDLSGGYVDTRI